jgi:hypothetical protein
MPHASGPSPLWAPVIAFVVVGVLALILRWAWSSRPESLLSERPRAGLDTDYGLLVPVAAPIDAVDGRRLAERLDRIGVRSTLTTTASGLRLLVFPADAERARGALGGAAD